MSSTPFGEHLKRERELRGVSLDEIAAATRIKTSFLEALENGRWNELPGGAFNRGFVRATARFLGLDEDGMVAEYALETGGESQSKLLAQPSGAMPRDYRPAVVAIAVLLVLVAGAAWFVHREISRRRQKRAAAAMAATGANAAAVAKASVSDAAKPLVSAPGTVAGTLPDASTNQPPPTTAPAPPPAAPSAPIAPEPLKLSLESSKTAQIRVMGDGKLLFKGRLHSDEPKNFQARDGFEVTSNEAGALKLQLNGEDIPFTGTRGRHGSSISLSREDLKAATESAR